MNMFKSTSAKTPEEYIKMIDQPRRSEVQKVFEFINDTMPGEKPFVVAGMIGFKSTHFKYASGREIDWPLVALASQKNYISVYVCAADGKEYVAEKYKDELPKANIGKSCIRFKKVSDIDLEVLGKVIKEGMKSGFSF